MKSFLRLIFITSVMISVLLAGCATAPEGESGESETVAESDAASPSRSQDEAGDADRTPVPLTREVSSADFQGTWLGTLKAGGSELRLVFHLTVEQNGGLSATLDSPDQGVTGIPATSVAIDGRSIAVEIASAQVRYEGKLSENGTEITGTWNQGGGAYAVDLEQVDKVEELTRPQDPERPLPYREEEVRFDNAEEGIILAGTLTIPDGDGPFPGVVLISGSGAQDRNEQVANHRPFLVLSDHLTRNGIAVLRYDDRGFGESGGNAATATSRDLAGDAWAAWRYLTSREEIDRQFTGLVGHSEGGVIAPMLAAEHDEIAFLVLLAAPGVPGDELLVLQSEAILRASGVPEDQIGAISQMNREIYDIIQNESDLAALKEKLTEALTSFGVPQSQIQTQVSQLTTPWYRFFLSYDPAGDLSDVGCPVLALTGSLDLQAPADENLAAIESALQSGGNQNVTTMKLEGLNHLFQHAETGLMNEYAQIEETFAPEAMNIISQWINDRARTAAE